MILLIISIFISVTSSSAVKVNCSFKKFKGKDGCFLKKIRIVSETDVIDIQEPKSKNSIEALHIQNDIVHYLPKSLLNNSQIQVLHVVNTELKFINKTTFQTTIQLEDIDLEKNDLTVLDADTFSNLKRLKSLNLAHNKLTTIFSKLFAGNENLENLVLSFNLIDRIHEHTFNNLLWLERLSLANNKITELRGKTFLNNTALISIDLSGNNLNFIDGDIFEPLKSNLKELLLNNNNCIYYDEKIFVNQDKSLNFAKIKDELVENCLPISERECKIEANKLSEENKQIKKNFESDKQILDDEWKKKFDIAKQQMDSKIVKLESELHKQRGYRVIETLKNDRLKEQYEEFQNKSQNCEQDLKNSTKFLNLCIDKQNSCDNQPKLLQEFSELNRKYGELITARQRLLTTQSDNSRCLNFEIICETPIIDSCKTRGVVTPFENMTLGEINSFGNLKSMVISQSFMTYIPANIFEKLANLQDLEISYSNLRFVNRGNFLLAQNLQNLCLLHNLISHLPDFTFKGANALKHLKLDSNGIKTLSEQTFGDLKDLEVLSLRDNDIADIPKKIFNDLINLKVLQLTKNKIIHLDGTLLVKNIKLQQLTISGNPLRKIGSQLLDNSANLQAVYYGNTDCIKTGAKATDIASFKKDIMNMCNVQPVH